jgi:hypothetical protein
MKKIILALTLFGITSSTCFANEAINQANSFSNIYLTLCMKHVSNLEELREKLKPVPKLPAEKAMRFLSGSQGDAWSVPDKHGLFVLALPTGKNMCAVHGRRASAEEVKKQFIKLVASAPASLTAKQIRNEQLQTSANGLTHTIAYEWSRPNAAPKLVFMLTTSASETAEIQALATVAITIN